MGKAHNTITFPQGPLPPNYNTENRSHVMLAVGILYLILELLAFGCRIFARRMNRVPFGWDDALMIPALLLNLGVCVMALLSIPYAGIGRHTLPVLLEDFNKIVFFGKDALLIIPLLYSLAIAFSKGAILNLFLRIFTMGITRHITWIIGAIVVCHTIACVFATIFQCYPIHLLWSAVQRENCISIQALCEFSSIPNVVTDLAMLILPLPTVWKLKASTQVKVGVTITLLTASIGILASILRMAGFFKADIFSDPCWLGADLMAYSVAEPGTYFLAACFPTYRPLITWIKTGTFFSTLSSRYRSGSKKYGNICNDADQSGKSNGIQEYSRAPIKQVREFHSIVLSNIERDDASRGGNNDSMERIV